jgi:coenzyme PQQ biosynthesis protein PqqD
VTDIPQRQVRRSLKVAWQSIEGETILLVEEKLLGLNAVAARVWQLIDGTRTVPDIADEIAQAFEGTPSLIREDVVSFVQTLADRGLVVEVTP